MPVHGEGDVQECVPGGDEESLRPDPTVGIVEAIGADHIDGCVGGGPHGCVGAQSAMSAFLVGVMVARWKIAIALSVRRSF